MGQEMITGFQAGVDQRLRTIWLSTLHRQLNLEKIDPPDAIACRIERDL
jgi:hypothetical protein